MTHKHSNFTYRLTGVRSDDVANALDSKCSGVDFVLCGGRMKSCFRSSESTLSVCQCLSRLGVTKLKIWSELCDARVSATGSDQPPCHKAPIWRKRLQKLFTIRAYFTLTTDDNAEENKFYKYFSLCPDVSTPKEEKEREGEGERKEVTSKTLP